MSKRVHDGNWWSQRPKHFWPQISHLVNHIFTSDPCHENCPINNKPVFKNPDMVEIEEGVEIGAKTIIKSSVALEGKTIIGKECCIGPCVSITDCIIGNGVIVGHGAQLKRCTIGNHVKIPHVCYLGDTTIGDGSNIGYNVGTSNFDGVTKNQVTIGPRCFIGTFVDFISPVILGEECFVTSRARVATKEPIPPHSFVAEEIRNGRSVTTWKENCSFKSPHHWLWLWTKTPVDPKSMAHFFGTLKANLGDYKEWLETPHSGLNYTEPRNIVKEYGDAGVSAVTNAVEHE